MPILIAGKTEFPYVEQIGTIYCGPACAQMMLKYFQIPIAADNDNLKKTEQEVLFGYIGHVIPNEVPIKDHSAWGGWITDPHRMINMLHKADDKSMHWINYFMIDKDKHPNLDSARNAFWDALVDRTKDESNAPPPIIPIHSESHWVVLYQYVDKDGKQSFNGNDPIYYDTKKKIGPSTSESFSWVGKLNIARKAVNFKNAENLVMIDQTEGNTNLISRMARQPVVPGEPNRPGIPGTPGVPGSPNVLPTKIIPAETIRKIVSEKLNAFGITGPCLAGRHIKDTAPTKPLLVKRLNRPPNDLSDDYYLIGLQKPNKDNYMLVRIDATTGLYLDSLGIPPTPYFLGKDTPDTLFNDVINSAEFIMPADLKLVFRDQIRDNPKLVWRPNANSLSAFYPFYEINTPSRKYYVRIDGRFFTASEIGLVLS